MMGMGYMGKDTPDYEYVVSSAYYELIRSLDNEKLVTSLLSVEGMIIYTNDINYNIAGFSSVLEGLKIPYKFYRNTWRADFKAAMVKQYPDPLYNFYEALGTPFYSSAENNDLMRKSILDLTEVQ